jgi:methylthioribose-1-phosphate isomerase
VEVFVVRTLNDRLPFILRRENVARYDDGAVVIGDRREYPFKQAFVRCASVEEVAQAIEDMVTQGGGPWVAAVYAMAMAAHQIQSKPVQEQRDYLDAARKRLVDTRPTNTALARQLARAMAVADQALSEGQSAEEALLEWIESSRDMLYDRSAKVGRFGADLIKDGDGVLTMCFAETSFLLCMAFAKEDGKRIRAYTPETRPYLQGARLTAPSIHELGIPVQIITDNMPAHLMSQGKIQIYFTAADLVTLDGHVVNKIGSFQNAIAADYHQIPYFVFSLGPDPGKPDRASIEIEERDPAEIRRCRGVPTTIDDIDAYYPAFDITPPHFVAGVITEYGVLSPFDLERFFASNKHL